MLEYAGQRGGPGHEWRCATLLAALAWTHRQFSQVGGTDIEWVCRDLTQHLTRSCREGPDIEVLVDAFANLGQENVPGGQSSEPSPAYVKLARNVLATLETRVNAGQLLRKLIANLPEQQAGDDSGIDELYRCYMNASRLQQFSCVPTDRMGCSSISGLDAAGTAAAGPYEIR